jgi:RNA polymerase sigma-70 factor (ECF subfamily)
MDRTDADLMERWRRGDVGAFETLVRRWQQPMARVLARLAGADRAPDLCQEVFLRVYQAGPRYRENDTFAAWLYRIALNVARDAYRRHREVVRLGNHEPLDDEVPPDTVCRRESVAVVARLVAELPQPQREVLVLHHHEKLNFEEIARLTGTPASTLKSRFAAALARLRAGLKQLGWGPEEEA